jgi:translation initiation factor 3 subunit L
MESGPQDIPDQVREFLKNLAKAVRTQAVVDIRMLYDTTFNQLTEQFFKIDNSPGSLHRQWPTFGQVTPYFAGDPVASFLYKELYYRYMYQHRDIPSNVRLESWENYMSFFQIVKDDTHRFDLPHSWLWDIMDEFIYQTQTNCHARSRDNDHSALRKNPAVWNPIVVIETLEEFVDRSKVRAILADIQAGKASPSVLTDYGQHHVVRMLGYNAMIMLLRVHTQLGDYYTALKTIEGSDLALTSDERSGVYNGVPACYMTLHYYAGFCCLMLRRFHDAFRLLSSSLRCKNYHIMSYQQQIITSLIRQATIALSIVVTLCPQKLDDAVRGSVKENSDELLQSGYTDEDVFKNMYKKACPKYITPVHEDTQESPFVLMEAHCRMLYREVQQQSWLPTLRSYLRLYEEISVKKVAALQPDATLTAQDITCHLLCWKHKSHQLVYSRTNSKRNPKATNALSGEFRNCSGGVDFFVQNDKIIVTKGDTNEVAVGGSTNTVLYLIREIGTMCEMEEELMNSK